MAGPRAKYLMTANATIKPFLTRPETIFNQIEALSGLRIPNTVVAPKNPALTTAIALMEQSDWLIQSRHRRAVLA